MALNRALGWQERSYVARNICSGVTISEWIITTCHIDVSVMKNAVCHAIQRHPNFRVGVQTLQEQWRI